MSEELDFAVADKVMGWHQRPQVCGKQKLIVWQTGFGAYDLYAFSPSTDIADAWRVVGRMRGNGARFRFQMSEHHSVATFIVGDVFGEVTGKTAPLAICKAALEAMEALENPEVSQ